MRVWLSDRPGALGAVASRIGSVKGDVVGIEILERGAGRAIDDLVVELPDASLVDLLIAEVAQVDGVDVEEVSSMKSASYDPDIEALEAAAAIVAMEDRAALVADLCDLAARALEASWAVVVDLDSNDILVRVGQHPDANWLAAYAHGSQHSAMVSSGQAGPDDTIAAPLPAVNAALVIGRDGRALRARERRRCVALARIADARLMELD